MQWVPAFLKNPFKNLTTVGVSKLRCRIVDVSWVVKWSSLAKSKRGFFYFVSFELKLVRVLAARPHARLDITTALTLDYSY